MPPETPSHPSRRGFLAALATATLSAAGCMTTRERDDETAGKAAAILKERGVKLPQLKFLDSEKLADGLLKGTLSKDAAGALIMMDAYLREAEKVNKELADLEKSEGNISQKALRAVEMTASKKYVAKSELGEKLADVAQYGRQINRFAEAYKGTFENVKDFLKTEPRVLLEQGIAALGRKLSFKQYSEVVFTIPMQSSGRFDIRSKDFDARIQNATQLEREIDKRIDAYLKAHMREKSSAWANDMGDEFDRVLRDNQEGRIIGGDGWGRNRNR